MTAPRRNSRDKILAAAVQVAREAGPGGLSLDAVAQCAGVSKGGLLYNFPTKASLMRGLVEAHIDMVEAQLSAAKAAGRSLLDAYFELSQQERGEAKSARSWVLTAMAENPDFMEPVKAFHRRLLDRLVAEAADGPGAVAAYLATEGLRSLDLFDCDVLTPAERTEAMARLRVLNNLPATG